MRSPALQPTRAESCALRSNHSANTGLRGPAGDLPFSDSRGRESSLGNLSSTRTGYTKNLEREKALNFQEASMTLKVLQVNTEDIGGSAECVADDLHLAYRRKGRSSWLAVEYKRTDSPFVFQTTRVYLRVIG